MLGLNCELEAKSSSWITPYSLLACFAVNNCFLPLDLQAGNKVKIVLLSFLPFHLWI